MLDRYAKIFNAIHAQKSKKTASEKAIDTAGYSAFNRNYIIGGINAPTA